MKIILRNTNLVFETNAKITWKAGYWNGSGTEFTSSNDYSTAEISFTAVAEKKIHADGNTIVTNYFKADGSPAASRQNTPVQPFVPSYDATTLGATDVAKIAMRLTGSIEAVKDSLIIED